MTSYDQQGRGNTSPNRRLKEIQETEQARLLITNNLIPSRGALRGMVDRGMLKMSDVTIIWKSGKIPNGPWALRSALPDGLKAAFTAFMLDLPKSHKDVYDQIEQGTGVGYVPATLDLYKDIIGLREAERQGSR